MPFVVVKLYLKLLIFFRLDAKTLEIILQSPFNKKIGRQFLMNPLSFSFQLAL